MLLAGSSPHTMIFQAGNAERGACPVTAARGAGTPAMNSISASLPLSSRPLLRRSVVLASLFSALTAGAVDYYWDANGAGTGTGNDTQTHYNNYWDIAATNRWRTGSDTGTLGVWAAGDHSLDTAVFGGTAGTVRPYEDGSVADVRVNGLNFLVGGYTLGERVNGSIRTFITLSGVDPTVTVAAGATATLDLRIDGTAGLIKAGAGTLVMGTPSFTLPSGSTQNYTGTNTYTGSTRVDAGTLQLGSSEQLDGASTLNVNGGTFALGTFNEEVASVTLTSGTISGSTGVLTATNGVTAQQGTVGAILGGTAGLTKTTAGTVDLNGNNTYSGATTVTAGTLNVNGTLASTVVNIEGGTMALGANHRLADASAVTVSGGTLAIGNYTDTVGLVKLTGGSITGGTTGQLTGSTYDMQSGTVSAGLSGGTGVVLTKSTTGTVILSGLNNYRGATTISGGTLVVNGALYSGVTPPSQGTTVGADGTLAGTGTVNGTVAVRGELAPGAFALNGTASIGTLTTGGQTGGFTLEVLGLSGSLAGTIANFDGTWSPTQYKSYTWTLLTASGGITGFEAGDFQIDLTGFTNVYDRDHGNFFVGIAGNNSLTLTYESVPEPATYAALLGAATLGFVGVRRWRQRRAAKV